MLTINKELGTAILFVEQNIDMDHGNDPALLCDGRRLRCG
jgi:hypothetical protein